MKANDSVLELFHPLVRRWFTERLGAPTGIQSKAWPIIARGGHALVTAPTGSGKTLTAFLWAINQLITGAWAPGRTRVLYVSPLKALNNDIRRNLSTPLDELKAVFREAGIPFPDIGVLTRSGDTPAEERRRMQRRPPEILITTPESLNILLSSRGGQTMLADIATVILDEIHAVVGTKRGTHLITAVERLTRLSGEFQRLALSATIKPLATVAAFVGGYRMTNDSDRYEKRSVTIIQSRERKRYAINVCFPENPGETFFDSGHPFPSPSGRASGASNSAILPNCQSGSPGVWPLLVAAFREIIKDHNATLLFANSRRTAEKVTRLINEGESSEFAYAHHGSLSREIRLAVEQRLKDGELKAIVATSSLELGIDIGALDRVILIQTPPAVASAIQRIGRASHRVGSVSHGLLFPTHGHDFLSAAVLARSVTEQDIETVKPIEVPLDVLAQIVISMTGMERWDIDELFAFMRTSYPYRRLTRRQFDLVLEMLAGRYADTRLRELTPRISLDRIDNTVHAKEGVQRLIYLSGGTIPDRGYYDLRVQETHAKIGELDEEFVWERSLGDTFTLGTQIWRIQKITPNDVEVIPTRTAPGIFPFWRAEDRSRDFHFSEKILRFLEQATQRLDDPAWQKALHEEYFLDRGAAGALIDYLKRQREATGADLPHRRHLLVEHVHDPATDLHQVILHTLWGGRINRPFGLALQAAWREKHGGHLEIVLDNDCILLLLPQACSTKEILALVTPENLERLLRLTLEQSGFFGAKFRENAGRALLLPRAGFKQRLPLWVNRMRAKKLMDAVMAYPDFPILLETWRTCLQDEFDLENLGRLLDEVRSGVIAVTEVSTKAASPFADGLIWEQTNTYLYADDTPHAGQASRLSRDLLQEVLFSQSLRPRIPQKLTEALEAKLQRTAIGYAPRSPDDLLDWVKERYLIPAPEWRTLLAAMERDHALSEEDALAPIRAKILSLRLPRTSVRMVCALENLPRVARAFGFMPEDLDLRDLITQAPSTVPIPGDTETITALNGLPSPGDLDTLSGIILQWLAYYGPVRSSAVQEKLGLEASVLDDLLSDPVENQVLILDLLTESSAAPEICDRENLEILLRMARTARRPSFQALGIERLPLFLAAWQGLTAPGNTREDLQDRLEQLFGYAADVQAWEKQILPARLAPYSTAWLDSLMQTSDLTWFGGGNKKLGFAFAEDHELFLARDNAVPDELTRLFPRDIGRYSVPEIARYAGTDTRTVEKKLWEFAWRGLVSNDTFTALRQGILAGFAPARGHSEPHRTPRGGYGRWHTGRPSPGTWYVIEREDSTTDPISAAELAKDRARQILKRYGILFRELLANELPPLQWSAVFKALRLMELSGEILSGYFFEGIPGVQFIAPEAFRLLNEPLPEETVYWLNAADPASLCGLRLDTVKLPSRLPSTHLVYHGPRLVLVSRRNGNSLFFSVPPDDPHVSDYLIFFNVLLAREFDPEKIITVETINSRPALESPYAASLRAFGFSGYHKGLELMRRYS